jgi:hypothetical protein
VIQRESLRSAELVWRIEFVSYSRVPFLSVGLIDGTKHFVMMKKPVT